MFRVLVALVLVQDITKDMSIGWLMQMCDQQHQWACILHTNWTHHKQPTAIRVNSHAKCWLISTRGNNNMLLNVLHHPIDECIERLQKTQ
jgi:hypothetical protein